MGTLFDLLKNAIGERSMHGAIGKWRQAVSLALDSGAAAPQYAYGKSSAVQAGIGNATDIDFESVGLVNGIPRTPGSPDDSWLLTSGNIYVLTAFGFFDTFSDAAAGSLRIQWVDETNTVLQSGGASCPGAFFTPESHAGQRSTAAGLQMVYQAGATDATRVVKVRCTAATGTASKPASAWSASIIQIPTGA